MANLKVENTNKPDFICTIHRKKFFSKFKSCLKLSDEYFYVKILRLEVNN